MLEPHAWLITSTPTHLWHYIWDSPEICCSSWALWPLTTPSFDNPTLHAYLRQPRIIALLEFLLLSHKAESRPDSHCPWLGLKLICSYINDFYVQGAACKSISNSHCKAIFGPPNVTVHAPAGSPNFFWSCYSSSLNLENTVVSSNQFFCLKNYPTCYYINSLSPPDFFFSLILSISHIIQTQNTKQNLILKIKLNQNKQIWKKEKKKKKKREKNKPIWPRFSHNPNTKHKTKSNS